MKVWGALIQPPSLDRALAAWLLNAGLMGRAEKAFFERTIRPGHRVLDVGANQGIFSLLFSRLVGPTGHVVSVEPEPTLFAALDRHCRLNGADNVTRLQMAAGDIRAEGALRRSRFNGGDNRVTHAGDTTAITVPIVPLDEALPTETADLIKIDVQGYEVRALHGMRALIDRSPCVRVFFEYWPEGLAHDGRTGAELIQFFLHRGFSLSEVTKAGAVPLDDADVERVKMMGGRRYINLLAHREGVDHVGR